MQDELRESVSRINEPQASRLLEATAETIESLKDAFIEYQTKTEEPWNVAAPMVGS